MAKKKDYNIVEINGQTYTVAERVREESNVREIPYTISEYIKEVDNEDICRDPLIQRTDDQWTRKQKSKLIEAILHNRSIDSIALAKGRAESKNYAVTSLLNGLQRTTAIVGFYHDEFVLDKRAKPVLCRMIDENGNEIRKPYEIAGKKYSQLPDAIKYFFKTYKLTTYMHEGFTDEELDDIVFCMNNGKTPNSYQKIRFLLGSEIMRELQPICDSDLWEDSKGCKAKNDSILCCVVRILMMMTYYNYNNLGSAAMTKFADDDFDDYVKKSDIENLTNLVEELAEIKDNLTGEEATRFDSITIPHYIMGLNSFKMKNKNVSEYTDFLRKFWSSEFYETFTANCVSNGSGGSLYSAQSVEDRQYAIDDCLDEYLDLNNNGDEENECDSETKVIAGEEQGTNTCDTGDNKFEDSFEESDNDLGTMQTDSNSCRQTSCIGQEKPTYTSDLSGSEQAIESA